MGRLGYLGYLGRPSIHPPTTPINKTYLSLHLTKKGTNGNGTYTSTHTHMRRLIYQQKEGCVNKWMQHGEFPLSWHVLGHFLWAVLGWDFGRRLWVWYDEGLAVATHPFGSFSVFNHSTCNPFSLIMSPRLLVYTYIYIYTHYILFFSCWMIKILGHS